MLTCYLDDSGTTPDSPVITLAGFVGFAQGWEAFERSAKEIYCNYEIATLHGKEFFSSDGEFTGWSRIKKQTFAWEVSKAARDARAIEIAISFSVRKETHAKRKAETGLDSTMSPYGYCFGAIIDQLLKDEVLEQILGRDGISLNFVVERGNRNDHNLLAIFNSIRSRYKIKDKRNSILFVGKDDSAAIQLADFFAFYSRRHVVAAEKNEGVAPPTDFINSRLIEGVHLIGIVATDFFVQDPTPLKRGN
jgi:hypothetical protein